MCGFVGFKGVVGDAQLDDLAGRMSSTISHRGPNDFGIWVDEDEGLALAHRRLSIIDLSSAGHQPMSSQSGRFVIVFNGEIYNHLKLRKHLQQEYWHGHSDTETLLAAIETWGVQETLRQLVGMFAFVLWDKKMRCLTFARDRLGEKPLYYGWQGESLLFASELKALRLHPKFRGEVDRNALALYMKYCYVPTPLSIYSGIYKLPPGTFLQIDADDSSSSTIKQPVVYWSASEVAESGLKAPYEANESETVDRLEQLLKQAIQGQMLADVPLGAFLSGGVDSSLIVALMQALSSRPVKTFTIGFREDAYNEAKYAFEIAKYLGTEHTELYISSSEAMAVIPTLPQIYDEPFADSSQIPTWLVSKLARQHVTVSLSGDGGDELFGGYNRYFLGKSIWDKLECLPIGVRNRSASFLTRVAPEKWNVVFHKFEELLPPRFRYGNPGDKLHKLAGVLPSNSPEDLYFRLISFWEKSEDIVIGSQRPSSLLTDKTQWPKITNFIQQMMALDTITYLPDDILVKVDRAAMNVGLETRVPFLDHRIIEFAWSLPLSMNVHNGQGKRVLRQILYKHVPKNLIERPKMGFGVPLDLWLRGPLRDWAESLLNESRLCREGFFHAAPIRKKWSEHISGNRNWQHHIWCVLMFQAWLESESV